MIYIFIPGGISETTTGGGLPFILYALSIGKTLETRNIQYKYSDLDDLNILSNATEDDNLIIWTALGHCELVFNFKGNMLIINSESLYTKERGIHFKEIIIQLMSLNDTNIICDYTNKNLKLLKKDDNYPDNRMIYCPFTYSEALEHHYNNIIPTPVIKDIDVLLFGCGNPRRQNIINNLNSRGHRAYIHCDVDYKKLYRVISRSKIVIIVNYYLEDFPIDFYRLSFLLSNKCFVINETPEEESKDDNFNKLIYAPYKEIVNTCEYWLKQGVDKINESAELQYQWWKNEHNMDITLSTKVLNSLISN